MQTGEMQRHGDTYYWYAPDVTAWSYKTRRSKWKEHYMWAIEQFGDPHLCDTIPARRWFAVDHRFNFLNAEDRMLMIMRWE